jgi:hypothetical protein
MRNDMDVPVEAGTIASRVPPPTDPRWRRLVTGETKRAFGDLGLRILMGRILRVLSKDPSEVRVAQCIGDVHAYFEKFAASLVDDLQKL